MIYFGQEANLLPKLKISKNKKLKVGMQQPNYIKDETLFTICQVQTTKTPTAKGLQLRSTWEKETQTKSMFGSRTQIQFSGFESTILWVPQCQLLFGNCIYFLFSIQSLFQHYLNPHYKKKFLLFSLHIFCSYR